MPTIRKMSWRKKAGLAIIVPLLFTVFGLAAGEAPSGEPGFRAGAAKSNVTPWLGIALSGHMQDRRATHVHSELYARCLVLDDGNTQVALVLVDNCMIPRAIFDAAKQDAHAATGIPIEHMLMSATHTHSGPCTTGVFQSDPDPEYNVFLARRIADGVRRAANNLEPARIAWGAGSVPDQVFNRRWHMRPGSIGADPFGNTGDVVRMNPPRESEDLVEPAGPTDPEVAVLAVQALDGRAIAVYANYSLHYVGASGADISSDYFGMFADILEGQLEGDPMAPPVVAMLSNGTSGDINNINFREAAQPRAPYEQTRLVAERVAGEVSEVLANLDYRNELRLGAAQHELELGVRLPSEDDIEAARAIVTAAEGPEMRGTEEIYARETLLLAEYPARMPVLVQALRIGDLGIAAIPCEVFVEFGLQIKAESPFAQTFTVSLANGYKGYLPTAQQHTWGGYETWRARSSFLEPEAGHVIVKQLLEMLEALHP